MNKGFSPSSPYGLYSQNHLLTPRRKFLILLARKKLLEMTGLTIGSNEWKEQLCLLVNSVDSAVTVTDINRWCRCHKWITNLSLRGQGTEKYWNYDCNSPTYTAKTTSRWPFQEFVNNTRNFAVTDFLNNPSVAGVDLSATRPSGSGRLEICASYLSEDTYPDCEAYVVRTEEVGGGGGNSDQLQQEKSSDGASSEYEVQQQQEQLLETCYEVSIPMQVRSESSLTQEDYSSPHEGVTVDNRKSQPNQQTVIEVTTNSEDIPNTSLEPPAERHEISSASVSSEEGSVAPNLYDHPGPTPYLPFYSYMYPYSSFGGQTAYPYPYYLSEATRNVLHDHHYQYNNVNQENAADDSRVVQGDSGMTITSDLHHPHEESASTATHTQTKVDSSSANNMDTLQKIMAMYKIVDKLKEVTKKYGSNLKIQTPVAAMTKILNRNLKHVTLPTTHNKLFNDAVSRLKRDPEESIPQNCIRPSVNDNIDVVTLDSCTM